MHTQLHLIFRPMATRQVESTDESADDDGAERSVVEACIKMRANDAPTAAPSTHTIRFRLFGPGGALSTPSVSLGWDLGQCMRKTCTPRRPRRRHVRRRRRRRVAASLVGCVCAFVLDHQACQTSSFRTECVCVWVTSSAHVCN